LFMTIPFIFSFAYQLKMLDINDSKTCLVAFKNNNLVGVLIFIFIFSFTFS